MCEGTHMICDCLNCAYSYVTDEDDELYCPFHGSEPVRDDSWCDAWKN